MATSRIIDPKTLKPFVYDRPRRGHGRPSSRYDAAQTTNDSRLHWANADGLSARAANDPGVRSKLRNRSRYEFANNGYCQGMVLTLADDVIGTGPRLQMLSPDPGANRDVEYKFTAWCEAVGLAGMLHTAKVCKSVDGEPFFLFANNPELTLPDDSPSPVQLDLLPVECDQFASPAQFSPKSMSWVDGIELDRRGRPAFYHLLKDHPGDTFLTGLPGGYSRIPAGQVIHWFRKTRPGQCRGVPEITPSLPLFAQLRRYTLATLTAAETAADFAALLESEAAPDGEDTPEPWDSIEIERGAMVTVPAGAKLAQLKAEQPTTTYPQFKHELLKEIGRPCSSPFNQTAGDSSLANYSSARLDIILRRVATRVERDSCRQAILDRVFAAWMREALMVPGFIPDGITAATPHEWRWPGFESIDPLKDAKADTERLANGTATYADIYGDRGEDWEDKRRQRAREVALDRELGIEPTLSAPAPEEEPADDDPAKVPAGRRLSEYLLGVKEVRDA